jgi:uncharacterized protein YjiS (DUF1127 family)
MITLKFQTQDQSYFQQARAHKTTAHKTTAQPNLLSTFGQWLHRTRTRRELAELPSYLLKDIGLNESDRYQEISKPFWQQ